MLILAIDTATKTSSVAVADENTLAAEITMEAKLTHSETLMPHIKRALEMADVSLKDIDGVAVSVGPGSFTGLRIGIAAAKAIAYALDVAIIGVPTLEAIAYGFPFGEKKIFALADAQKNSAYVEGFRRSADGVLQNVFPVRIMPIKDFVAMLYEENEAAVLAGDVVKKKIAGSELPANVFVAPPRFIMPRAANVAALGMKKLAAGECSSLMLLEPSYLRRSEAEILWDKRSGEKNGQLS